MIGIKLPPESVAELMRNGKTSIPVSVVPRLGAEYSVKGFDITVIISAVEYRPDIQDAPMLATLVRIGA